MLSVPLVAPLKMLAVSMDTKSVNKLIFVEAKDVNALSSIYDLID